MDCANLADEIARRLQALISALPKGFYDSFDFTQTGNNWTHPVTLGLLSRLLWEIPGIANLAVDVRLNLGGGVKFQPDFVGLDSDWRPMAMVDYESPNSSDARLPVKDVDTYLAWRRQCASDAPYVIITTLPDRVVSTWELRYAAPGYYNAAFCGRRGEICENPFRFWQGFYLQEFGKRQITNVALVNIDGQSVRRSYPL